MDELTTFSTVDDYSDVSVLSIILYMCCLSVCLLGRLSSFLFLRVCARAFQPCVSVCCVGTLVSRQQAPMFCFPVMHSVAADRPSSCCSPPRSWPSDHSILSLLPKYFLFEHWVLGSERETRQETECKSRQRFTICFQVLEVFKWCVLKKQIERLYIRHILYVTVPPPKNKLLRQQVNVVVSQSHPFIYSVAHSS